MTGNQRELSEYRLSQARDSLREADVLLREGMSPRSVMNRLYYAMFYAVLALLQAKQLGTSKHSGAIALFDREFVKTGILPKELSKALHRAFELRQKGDYMEEAEITPADLEEVRPLVENFLEKAESVIPQM
jgi:uncharacterized protein (UPF0332 family)